MEQQIRAVLFDMDGLMFDTELLLLPAEFLFLLFH